nr:hypothetical protein [Tanacetum cinerariifolium]
MTTLVDKDFLSGADNRPPMLEKDMYDSLKSKMELYLMNRQHGRMILESIENIPLICLMIKENDVTRPRKMLFLSAVITSCYPTTNNQLRNSSNPRQRATINDRRVTLQPVHGIQLSFAIGFKNPFYLKKAHQLEPKLCDGNVIKNACAIVIPDSEETLMLPKESYSKMLLQHKDPMAFWSLNSMNSSDPSLLVDPLKLRFRKNCLKSACILNDDEYGDDQDGNDEDGNGNNKPSSLLDDE